MTAEPTADPVTAEPTVGLVAAPTADEAADELRLLPPTVVVTVGGDYHPFDRLMRWVQGWLAGAGSYVRCVVQYGTATVPAGLAGAAFLGHDELVRYIAAASAVVTSGGPSTVNECLAAGVKPIVVPRRQALGEVVDGHQGDFCRRMAAKGLIVLAETEAELHQALSMALADPAAFRLPDSGDRQRDVDRTVARIGALIDEAVGAGGRRSLIGRAVGWRRHRAHRG